MTLAALGALILSGQESAVLLKNGFAEFSRIAVLFTAIAVPAHILQRSDALGWIGMRVGELTGKLNKLYNINPVFLVTAFSLSLTYVMAALFHNTTSILIMATLVAIIAKSYGVPGIPILSGALIASNLGGFSTRWGDTPNIIEAQTWGLQHDAFFRQILPINMGLLILVIFIVSAIAQRIIKKQKEKSSNRARIIYSMVEFRTIRRNTEINKRLFVIGLVGLVIAIFGSLFLPTYELLFAAGAIIFCVLADFKEHRTETLFALGLETYATLLSIFVIAQVVAHSNIGIGSQLHDLLQNGGGRVSVIVLTSYFGTLFTEAASWASATSPIVHLLNNSSQAAWALGAGICAGSSSLVTAATAGIILANETKDNEEGYKITFSKYIPYGFGISAFMVLYYILTLNLFF
jgi:Na+/H+ antiporter NhaD/arsenite permease-like protein